MLKILKLIHFVLDSILKLKLTTGIDFYTKVKHKKTKGIYYTLDKLIETIKV